MSVRYGENVVELDSNKPRLLAMCLASNSSPIYEDRRHDIDE
jgi:hypothetical protein